VQLETLQVTTEMPYNVQVTRDYRKAKTLRGRKDIISPHYFFIWGAVVPLAHPLRIDATVKRVGMFHDHFIENLLLNLQEFLKFVKI